jgi:hypothetical protein
MDDFMDMQQYTGALNISAMSQQFAQAKEAFQKQKDEALAPIAEMATGIAGTAGIEQVGSLIKNAVIAKGKELLASKLDEAGVPKEISDKVLSGDFKGGFEEALAKAKSLVADKVESLKGTATDAVENLKQQGLAKVEELKQQGQDALEEAKSDLADKLDQFRAQAGVEDGFPVGTELTPQGAGGRVPSGVETEPPVEGITEPVDSFQETANVVNRTGNIQEDFAEADPEAFMGYTPLANTSGLVGLQEGVVGDVSKVISGISDTATGAIGEATGAITEGVSGAVSGAVAAGGEAAAGIASAVGEGLAAASEFLGPIGIIGGIVGGIVGLFEADKPMKALGDVINPSAQFGA